LLFAAVSLGAAVAALTTGWLGAARRLGLITVAAVWAWGLAIAGAGLAGSLWPAAALLALAGAADSVSAVCRSVINQTVTPDAMRGRMSSVFSLVVTSGPRLGDVEAGVVASLTSVRTSVVSGGLACVAGALVVSAAFPALIAYDKQRALAEA
jgi:MFS family permease